MPSPADNAPQHVAIIMDGNGRWAKQRGLPRIEGHRRGVETVRTTMAAARDLGIRVLTLYAFSIENWKRPQEEVGALMGLLEHYLKKELDTFIRDRVRFRPIGRTEELPANVQKLLRTTMEETKHFTEHTLALALNYGSRTEVVDAARAYAAAVAAGKEKLNDSSWATFSPPVPPGAPAVLRLGRDRAVDRGPRLRVPQLHARLIFASSPVRAPTSGSWRSWPRGPAGGCSRSGPGAEPWRPG
jgi:undecaprenyl diphosphate synthase